MSETNSNNRLYEYAVLRYVPRVEREEFINIGLLMMCKKEGWCRARVHLEKERLNAIHAAHSPEEILQQTKTFTNVAEAATCAGPMALLPAEERFRWLTAVKSSVLQTSRPHPGITEDLEATFERLYQELVL